MTDKVEIQGKTVDEAVQEALLRMGARRDEVDVTVLEEPKSGLFGLIGNRPARVIVRRRAGGARRGRSNDFRVDSSDHPAHELGSGDGRGGRRGSRGGRGRGGRSAEAGDATAEAGERRGGRRGENRGENRGEGRNEARGEGRGERRGGRSDRRQDGGRGEARAEGRGEGQNERRGGRSDRRRDNAQAAGDAPRPAAVDAAPGQEGDEARSARRRRGRRGGRGRGGSGREGREGRENQRMPVNTAGEHIEDDVLRSIADEQAQFHARIQAEEARAQAEARGTADDGGADDEGAVAEGRGEGRTRGRRGGRSRGGRGRGRGEGRSEDRAEDRADERADDGSGERDEVRAASRREPREERRAAAEPGNGRNEPILPADDAGSPDLPAAAAVEEPIAIGIKAVAYAQPKRGLEEATLDAGLTELTSGMLVRAGFPCRCEVKPGEYRQVRVVTDDISAGMLIGRHGQAIDAVEHLVERMASTAAGDRVRMNLDINNYRRRREDSLEHRVDQAVAEARNTGREVHLDPMDARDRRLVHLQAEEMGMRTWTVSGEGGKHVVISLENNAPRNEDFDPVEVTGQDEGYEAEGYAADAPTVDETEEPGADA